MGDIAICRRNHSRTNRQGKQAGRPIVRTPHLVISDQRIHCRGREGVLKIRDNGLGSPNEVEFLHIRLDGTQDLQTKVMITLFGLFAEIERDLIAERTKEGLAAARAKGRLPGRPKGVLGTSKLTGREAEIQSLLAKTVSKASIAKILGVSRSTLHAFIQTRRLA